MLYLIVMIVQAAKGIYGQDVNAVCSTLLVFLIGIITLETGKITILLIMTPSVLPGKNITM